MNAYYKYAVFVRINEADVDYEAQPNNDTNIYFEFVPRSVNQLTLNFTEI